MDITSTLKRIEKETPPDLSRMDAHWIKMREMLAGNNLSVDHTDKIVDSKVVYFTISAIVSLCLLINALSMQKDTISVEKTGSPEKRPAGNNIDTAKVLLDRVEAVLPDPLSDTAARQKKKQFHFIDPNQSKRNKVDSINSYVGDSIRSDSLRRFRKESVPRNRRGGIPLHSNNPNVINERN